MWWSNCIFHLCCKYVIHNFYCIFSKSNVIVACDENQIRFGDFCYEELSTAKQSVENNANQCLDKFGHLWYPQTASEFAFVKDTFPVASTGDEYNLGILMYFSDHSMMFSDYSYHPGITHYTGILVFEWLNQIILSL